jgi:hypothetical protein
MSDQPNNNIEIITNEAEKTKVFDVQTLKVRVRPLEKDAPGFMPRYRAMLAAQRAFTQPQKATPEDVDGARALLFEHIIEPEDEFGKNQILDLVTVDELTKMFSVIMGAADSVPPAKGAA